MNQSLHLTLVLGASLYGCSGDGDVTPDASVVVELQSIDVTAPTLMVVEGVDVRFRAEGVYTDESRKVLTGTAMWTSSDTSVATIGTFGIVSAIKEGTTVITAAFEGKTGMATLTVTGSPIASIDVQPRTVMLHPQGTSSLTAMATLEDETVVDVTNSAVWSSSDEGVATVSAGVVTAVVAGDATISAMDSGSGVSSGIQSAKIEVRDAQPVGLVVTPPRTSLAVGRTQQLAVAARFADDTTVDVTSEVTWSSNAPEIATVSDTGLVTTVSDGLATITAHYEANNLNGSARITVTPPVIVSLSVTPVTTTLQLRAQQTFTAMARYSDGAERTVTSGVVWQSSDESIVTISNMAGQRGEARAVAEGTATISAMDMGSGLSSDDSNESGTVTVLAPSLASIIVLPGTANIAAGLVEPFRAFGVRTDDTGFEMTDTATWSSSNPAVATVDAMGNVEALTVGTTVITAIDPVTGISSATTNMSAQVTVDPPILVSIAVTPMTAAMVVSSTLQLTATAMFSDGVARDVSTTVTWTPSSAALTISPSGFATAQATGSVTVVATDPASGVSSADSGESSSILISATSLVSVAITPSTITIPGGADTQLTATGTYVNGATVDITELVTWSSSMTSVANVSNVQGSRGIVRGLSSGTTSISVIEPASGVSSDTTMESSLVTVAAGVTLQSIVISPPTSTFNVNQTAQLTAMGTFSDMSMHSVTQSVIWASSDPTAATVSNAEGSAGLVTGVGVGSAIISATYGGVSSDTNGQSASVTIQQGIEIADIVHYELDDGAGSTVANLAPGQPNGTITGSFTWNTPGGAPGTSSHYLTMPASSANSINPALVTSTFTNLTIEFWWRYNSGTSTSYMWNSSISFRAFTGGVAATGVYVRATPGGTDIVYTPSVQDNAWHHMAYVLDASAGVGTFYVDGVPSGTSAYSGSITLTGYLLAGQASTNSATVDYDRFRMWSTAQSAAQVASMAAGTR